MVEMVNDLVNVVNQWLKRTGSTFFRLLPCGYTGPYSKVVENDGYNVENEILFLKNVYVDCKNRKNTD